MVQNTSPRPRGRPPSYDRDEALSHAGDTFWQAGYAATTLDELSAATGMNRPSLYGAFGDKHTLYLQTLARYAAASRDKLDAFLAEDLPLGAQLMAMYDAALGIYLSGEAPRGCFLIGTALSESVTDEVIRTSLLEALHGMDASFEARFVRAKANGELARDADPKALAQVAGAVLNALAVRARAGEASARLRVTARTAVTLICGPESRPRAGKPR
jgi:TetR/AcrR family transcriptional regulator, copper-responsive repressor